MGFLNKIFGFRWSLYIVRNGNHLAYAMHEHSVIRMLGYVMRYFADGGRPVEPWSLHINFNRDHRAIKLEPEHFSANGENIAISLIRLIESIDPGWEVKSAEPVFEEAATKKRMKISEQKSGEIDIQAMLDNLNSSKELTFHTVMDEVFGKHG